MRVPIGTDIYLKFGKKIKIPVNPSEINITTPTNNKTYEVLSKGEVVVQMPSGLKEVSFESYVSNNDEPFTDGSISPRSFVKALQKAMDKKIKGRLIISRSDLFDTNMRCIIEEFTTKDKGGEPDDIYYSIKLREYRDYSAQSVTLTPMSESERLDTGVDTAQATATSERPIETPVLRVGAQVIVNGPLCYDSAGNPPWQAASGLSATVARIESGGAYPIYVGSGWVQESELQIVG
jgi:hypothetical protein